ncbi:hypothetical protein Nepgr_028392 [Nepenthes gracilis]|uniref:U-box domain-containing protein n=1 Tax=Nepenthes gracilis TaxID=150966 RepID=A0AAD3Y428_NEPGR|nr:hypothetical protein Nepgr_028392 [Nepenthes gracilis]
MQNEIEIPPFFLCPISLEIMRDPVAISTGITYDRANIEKWIFSSNNTTCPVTKQHLRDFELTPNHTLRRLIQSWCSLNASSGVERIPTPKPPADKAHITRLIDQASTKSPHTLIKCLAELRAIASESAANRRSLEAAGAVEFLSTIIVEMSSNSEKDRSSSFEEEIEQRKSIDEALSALHHLQLSESALKKIADMSFLECLTKILQRSNYESCTFALDLMQSVLESADPMRLASLSLDFFTEIVQILQDQISSKATKTALKLLIHLCPWGRNRVKASEAGAVSALIDLLLDCSDKRISEMTLVLLDQLCGCAEGRAELLSHGAGLAVVSKKIFRVSNLASERAVRILFSVSRFSGTATVAQEMAQLGVVAKLWLVLQVDCEVNTKEQALEILKLHAKAWKNSPCIPPDLLVSYPS